MKGFRKNIFILSFIIVGFILIPSFLAAFGEDEGTLGTNPIWIFFAKIFYALRFPTHTLFWKLFSSNGTLYLMGLFINCLFYATILERVVYLIKIYLLKKED